MKNIILALILCFPFLSIAQSNVKNSEVKKENVFVYISMEYISEASSIKSPKKSREGVRNSDTKKTNYLFVTQNQRLTEQLTKLSANFTDEMSALNFLGKMGWELIDINNGKYYFKTNRRK